MNNTASNQSAPVDLGDRLLVPIPDVCRRLSLGRTTVIGLLDSGQIHVGRRRLVAVDDLANWVGQLRREVA